MLPISQLYYKASNPGSIQPTPLPPLLPNSGHPFERVTFGVASRHCSRTNHDGVASKQEDTPPSPAQSSTVYVKTWSWPSERWAAGSRLPDVVIHVCQRTVILPLGVGCNSPSVNQPYLNQGISMGSCIDSYTEWLCLLVSGGSFWFWRAYLFELNLDIQFGWIEFNVFKAVRRTRSLLSKVARSTLYHELYYYLFVYCHQLGGSL